MRIRKGLALALVSLIVVSGAYSSYVFAMSKKWLHSIHYDAKAIPSRYVTRTDMFCQSLAIDSLDFRYKGGTRGNRSVFGVKIAVDSIVLRSTYGPKFCDTYAKVHKTERDAAVIKSLDGAGS